MKNVASMIFALMGLLMLVGVIYMDKAFAESPPVDTWVYWIIGGYILLCFLGPTGAKFVAQIVTDRFIPSPNKNGKKTD